MWRLPQLQNVNPIDIVREGGEEDRLLVRENVSPFPRRWEKGIKNRFVVTLILQAMHTTLITEGISMAEYWTQQYRRTHFSPANTDCAVRKLVRSGLLHRPGGKSLSEQNTCLSAHIHTSPYRLRHKHWLSPINRSKDSQRVLVRHRFLTSMCKGHDSSQHSVTSYFRAIPL